MILEKQNGNKVLTHGLFLYEFRCRCTYDFCRAVVIDKKLLKAYREFRMFIGSPLVINSGHRCQKWNKKVNGVKCSKHIAGRAIDIDAKSLLEVFSEDEIKEIACQCGFSYVKYYSGFNFFHMHV